jgi:hypothetical protein
LVASQDILNAGATVAIAVAIAVGRFVRVPILVDFAHGQEAVPPAAIIDKSSL